MQGYKLISCHEMEDTFRITYRPNPHPKNVGLGNNDGAIYVSKFSNFMWDNRGRELTEADQLEVIDYIHKNKTT